MHKEWVNPKVDVDNGVSFRSWVADMHSHLTADGTGITQMATPGQFDFITETIAAEGTTNIMKGKAMSKPLYYKYESIGNKTLYIKFKFGYFKHSTAGSDTTPTLLSKVGVWENIEDAIAEKPYYKFPTTIVPAMKWSTSNRRQIGNHIPATGNSYLINNNGTLMIAIHTGFIPDASVSYRYTSPLLFLYIEAKPDGFRQYRHTNGSTIEDDNVYSSGGTSITNAVYNTSILSVIRNNATEMNSQEYMYMAATSPTFMQVVGYTHESELYSMNKLMYYNKSRIGGDGFTTIAGRTVYMFGETMNEYNMGDTNKTMAVLVD